MSLTEQLAVPLNALMMICYRGDSYFYAAHQGDSVPGFPVDT